MEGIILAVVSGIFALQAVTIGVLVTLAVKIGKVETRMDHFEYPERTA